MVNVGGFSDMFMPIFFLHKCCGIFFHKGKTELKFIFNSCLLGFNYSCLKILYYVYVLSSYLF